MVEYTDDEWDEIGNKWRKAAKMDDVPRLEAPAFIRWLKHSGYIRDYICVPDADLPNAEGKYEPDEGRLYYRKSTWRRAEEGNPHDVWTLIHEGCHAILKHGETRLRASTPGKRIPSRRAGSDEVDANRLAASILAPFDKAEFRPGTSADAIAERFRLSRTAAESRLKEFERIYRAKNGISRPLPPGIVDFLQAQKRKGYKVTSVDDAPLSPTIPNKRYEGEACPSCSEFKLVRTGLCMRCDACLATTGED
jgi:hypothetical protein